MDGKHQAVAETVVEAAVGALADQAGLLHLGGGETALLEQVLQGAAAAIGIAQAELLDGFARHAAAFEVRAAPLRRPAH